MWPETLCRSREACGALLLLINGSVHILSFFLDSFFIEVIIFISYSTLPYSHCQTELCLCSAITLLASMEMAFKKNLEFNLICALTWKLWIYFHSAILSNNSLPNSDVAWTGLVDQFKWYNKAAGKETCRGIWHSGMRGCVDTDKHESETMTLA